MIWQYLKTDIVGVASRIVYGEQGERVYVVKNEIDMLLVMGESGNPFYIKADEVSDTPISKKIKDEQPTTKTNNRKSVQRIRR